MEMPAETLVSVTFNILESINAAELGRLLENIARSVNVLHEGCTDKRFREFAENFLNKMLENADVDEVKKTFTALLEDAGAISEASVKVAWEDPIVAITFISAIPAIVNTSLRILNASISKFDEMPAEVVAQTAASMLSKIKWVRLES